MPGTHHKGYAAWAAGETSVRYSTASWRPTVPTGKAFGPAMMRRELTGWPAPRRV